MIGTVCKIGPVRAGRHRCGDAVGVLGRPHPWRGSAAREVVATVSAFPVSSCGVVPWRQLRLAGIMAGMAGRADLDLYNVLLGFGWARERAELVKATLDPRFLLRARRALFPLPIVDRAQAVTRRRLPAVPAASR